MRSWKVQVAINTAKTLIPAKQSVRQFWRHISPYRTDPQKDACLFDNAIRQILALRQASVPIAGKRVLEIGTGWHPIPALVFRAAGASHILLTDIERLLDPQTLKSAAAFVRQRANVMLDRVGVCDLQKLDIKGDSFREMLHALRLAYHVPFDAGKLQPNSVDIVTSCSVLEHIRPTDLRVLLRQLRAGLSDKGAMMHFIDNSDHFEQQDKTISRLHFLRFEDRTWNILCLNPQSVHNRFRHSDYVTLFNELDFSLRYEWKEVREREIQELAAIPLASRFKKRSPEDLAAISSGFVITKKSCDASAGLN